MLQNPHHYPWRHAPSLVQDHPAGADKHWKDVADRTLLHARPAPRRRLWPMRSSPPDRT